MNPSFRIVMVGATEKIRRTLTPRVRFILPFITAGSLVWLGLTRLRPALRESQQQTRELGELLGRVEQSESIVLESDSQGLTERMTGVLSNLMTTESDVIQWLQAAESKANQLGWRTRHDIGEIEALGTANFEIQRIPLRLVLRPDFSRTNPVAGGCQLLQMGAWIAQNPHRSDLVGISVSAPEAGIQEATITVHLWMGPPLP